MWSPGIPQVMNGLKATLMIYPIGGVQSKVCSQSEDEYIDGFSVDCDANFRFGILALILNVLLIVSLSSYGFSNVYRKIDNRKTLKYSKQVILAK